MNKNWIIFKLIVKAAARAAAIGFLQTIAFFAIIFGLVGFIGGVAAASAAALIGIFAAGIGLGAFIAAAKLELPIPKNVFGGGGAERHILNGIWNGFAAANKAIEIAAPIFVIIANALFLAF